ncbi:glutaredoxin family protein [Lentibacillus juripiscarius]|uniref:Glutaredoxin family protein n=1 Tax=Lentibacillus juripiscarius TaxID=257446 RepID=A0ABW5V5Z3_9BACI
MQHLLFYTKENCPLCDQVQAMLDILQHEYTFEIEVRDIYSRDEWLEEYQLLIPAVEIGGKALHCEEISYEVLEQALKKTTKA